MVDFSTGAVAAHRRADRRELERAATPLLAPCERAIDRDHLARMTLGEPGLDLEVLRLFDRQASLLLARMGCDPAMAVAAHAHTLAGSARGIGAWKVAEAAAALEQLAAQPGPAPLAPVMNRLVAAVAQAQAAIAELLPAEDDRQARPAV